MLHCIQETGYYPRISRPVSPWTTLIQTCSRWRSLGLRTTFLWSYIDLRWRARTIDNFLLHCGNSPLQFLLNFRDRESIEMDTRKFSSYLSQHSLKISDLDIVWPIESSTDGLAKFIADHVVPLDLPVLQNCAVQHFSWHPMESNIPNKMSTSLKALKLFRIRHPISELMYESLNELYIAEVALELSEFFNIFRHIPSLRILELRQVLQAETRANQDTESLPDFIHPHLQSLVLGAIPKNDADIVFSKIQFPSLRNICLTLEYDFGQDVPSSLELPNASSSFIRDPTSLKLQYHRPYSAPSFIISSRHSRRTAEICFSAIVGHLWWNSILSLVEMQWQTSDLTTLHVDIASLCTARAWSTFLRRHSSSVTRLIWTQWREMRNLREVFTLIRSDDTLLPRLESLDICAVLGAPREMMDWLRWKAERRKLRVLILPNRFGWRVTRSELEALVDKVVIAEDPTFEKRAEELRFEINSVYRVVES
ncbi:hypothetical protein SISSUDRAFT_1062388 [Sistotremastrum suecicum HHB10207 ss-3]|uniref:F-box domain-containing protein n=1 Tax=Sistotremastrum suecicum HHB10207 ss-3 TaxID=1314776 RepID=A0A166D003_9AGAM|nr:hypothetical protein SISSUDRAFT_1062388 [Sistotremastrum suecicum HHB10207 ss-3]